MPESKDCANCANHSPQVFWRYRLASWNSDGFVMFTTDDERTVRRALERHHGQVILNLKRLTFEQDGIEKKNQCLKLAKDGGC